MLHGGPLNNGDTGGKCLLKQCDREDAQRAREEAAAKLTQDMLQKFEEDWRPAVENLEEAALAFDDLEGARRLPYLRILL